MKDNTLICLRGGSSYWISDAQNSEKVALSRVLKMVHLQEKQGIKSAIQFFFP
jgi:hypothetical protein